MSKGEEVGRGRSMGSPEDVGMTKERKAVIDVGFRFAGRGNAGALQLMYLSPWPAQH